ncbi:LuxR C-terminal-related transcriptional regulator [Streptococcus danieliae]|uniref:LuxR C-terminal-related transcriptional regulator n=1 Tax=Streptococcus danieliae TaxID=747656 RepID=UPI0019218642|nr:LuxR C-terminal-related transcriptional regulator [Streptococcus danieliae]
MLEIRGQASLLFLYDGILLVFRGALYLLRRNYTQEKIASTLTISRRTVNNHLAHINDKLNTQSSMAAVLRAIELGIL